jgi:aldehyde dehydrogenase (NAD+)
MSQTTTPTLDPELSSVLDHARQFFIDGEWVDPISQESLDVIDPATERPIATIVLGGEADVDRAVAAARAAFPSFSETSEAERIALLERVIGVYRSRMSQIATAVRLEMGAPKKLAARAQAPAGLGHLMTTLKALRDETFEEQVGSTTVVYEPVGVCGFITPWNWPLNQIAAKVAPALATGCTMILKPSEIAPLNAIAFAEVLEEAGVPRGVFNLVNGDGPTVGHALTVHPDIDMISFTGSTRAGIQVAQDAAPTVKRVAQELGGKSANIFLDDDSLPESLARDVKGLYVNSGQSCNAGSRMLVPAQRMDEAIEIARQATADIVVGAPDADQTAVGPVVSRAQFDKVQGLIEAAIEEGATLVAGGPGRPEGLTEGYYVRPTVFANVTNDMRIAREEIFGPCSP